MPLYSSWFTPDTILNLIAVAHNDSGVGVYMADAFAFGDSVTVPFRQQFPFVVGQKTDPDSIYINRTQMTPYSREVAQDSTWEPRHWINEFGFAREHLYMFDTAYFNAGYPCSTYGERFDLTTGIIEPTNDTVAYNENDRFYPLIMRNISGGGQLPIVSVGSSISGKGRNIVFTGVYDWWYSKRDTLGKGWARFSTMADIFWRGIAWVARDGIIAKVRGRYISDIWDLDPPTGYYPPLPSGMNQREFLLLSNYNTVKRFGVPITFRILSHPYNVSTGGYRDEDFRLFRLMQANGDEFVIRRAHNNAGGDPWGWYKADGKYYSHTDSSFEAAMDSIESFQRRSGLKFAPTFSSGSGIDWGAASDSFPVLRWVREHNIKSFRTAGCPLYQFAAAGMTKSEHAASAKFNWSPPPFGSQNCCKFYFDSTRTIGFVFKSHFDIPSGLNQDLYYDWANDDTLACPWCGIPHNGNRLDSALVRFKSAISAALEQGQVTGVPFYVENIYKLCDLAEAGGSPGADSNYWASVRWDSMWNLCMDFIKDRKLQPVTMYSGMGIMNNLDMFDITSYSRTGNKIDLVLQSTGDMYRETEITLFYGQGQSRTELPIKIPPFSGTLNMTIYVVEQNGSYCVEVY